jgi:Tfp pilus assembly protein PilO
VAYGDIARAASEWRSAQRERLALIMKINATVAAIQTVEKLKAMFPELSHHIELIERQLPVATDGSNLIAELSRAGMQFEEVAA